MPLRESPLAVSESPRAQIPTSYPGTGTRSTLRWPSTGVQGYTQFLQNSYRLVIERYDRQFL